MSESEILANPSNPVQFDFQIDNNQTLFHTPPDVRNHRIQKSQVKMKRKKGVSQARGIAFRPALSSDLVAED